MAEANDLLPHLLAVFEMIQALNEQLTEKRAALELLHDAARTNGGHKLGAELTGISESITRLMSGLEEEGIILKDVEAGLVDFPHLREEREVFLCWRRGEKVVEFWHELDTGFRGRQPL